jgi:hypothetical protein
VVVSAVLGLVAAVLVLAATTWRISRAEAQAVAAYNEKEEEEARTRDALDREVAQRARAESNYRQARKVLDFLTRLGVEDLADKPQMKAVRRRLLTELHAYYQEFIDQHGDNPAITAELIEARWQVAQLLDEIGNKAESLAHFDKAMRDRAHLPGGRGPFPFFGPPRGLARVYLLGQPAVQKDLHLSAEQVKQVAAMVDLRDHPSGESLAAAEKALGSVLRPDQGERLQQIIRQLRGPHALLDRETAKALGLTEGQREAIHAIRARRPPEPGRSGGPGRPGQPGRPRRGRGRPNEANAKQLNEQALQVLDPEQRARWQALLGEPFQGDLRALAGPGGKPGGRGKMR